MVSSLPLDISLSVYNQYPSHFIFSALHGLPTLGHPCVCWNPCRPSHHCLSQVDEHDFDDHDFGHDDDNHDINPCRPSHHCLSQDHHDWPLKAAGLNLLRKKYNVHWFFIQEEKKIMKILRFSRSLTVSSQSSAMCRPTSRFDLYSFSLYLYIKV